MTDLAGWLGGLSNFPEADFWLAFSPRVNFRSARYSGGSTELRWQDLTPRSVPETPLELLRQAQAPQHIDKPGVATEISEGRIDLQERDILAVMFCVSLV